MAHLTVLTAFLSVGLCAGLIPVAFFPPIVMVGTFIRIQQIEGIRPRLAEVAARDSAALEKAEPAKRPEALRLVEQDAQLDEKLGRMLERTRRERQARLDALGWFGRSFADQVEKQLRDGQNAQGEMTPSLPPVSQPDSVRAWALTEATPTTGMEQAIAPIQTIMLLFWPVVWVVWAFLARGGLTFPLMGLWLVRGNGRPALRVQCAWRALLVWVPVTGFAIASVWLYSWYWLRWPGDGSDVWMLWASSAAWWASLALLPLYAALAIWFPRRSWHDWLAGTYLVPR
jgi:hypothetical protein